VVTRDEDQCYVCGDHVPRHTRAVAKPRPVSPLTNIVFLASLGFTIYCFVAGPKLSLPVTLAISSALLGLRIIAERLLSRNSK